MNSRDDGLLQAAYELAGRTKQRSPDRLGVRAQGAAVSSPPGRLGSRPSLVWQAVRLPYNDDRIMRILAMAHAYKRPLHAQRGF